MLHKRSRYASVSSRNQIIEIHRTSQGACVRDEGGVHFCEIQSNALYQLRPVYKRVDKWLERLLVAGLVYVVIRTTVLAVFHHALKAVTLPVIIDAHTRSNEVVVASPARVCNTRDNGKID